MEDWEACEIESAEHCIDKLVEIYPSISILVTEWHYVIDFFATNCTIVIFCIKTYLLWSI